MLFKIVITKLELIDRNKRYDTFVNLISVEILAKSLDLIFKQYYKFITLHI